MPDKRVVDYQADPSLGEYAISLVNRYATKRTLRRWEVSDIYGEQVSPYTYVNIVLRHKDNGKLATGTGFSKQRPTDTWNREIGYRVALSRAIKDALGIKGEDK